ncbi:MAG: gamma-glutamyl-gamma-aminobutyrate hydrolase family protein [Planctomycetota bacterium]|nr:MAG: gamma-glutamyl-gamma-aminobutyrate hydrolase family protein [Planctomycetota bacterium]
MAFPPRPLIAITTSLEPGERPKLSLGTRYADAVLRAGGIPLAIPPVGGPTDVERLVERVDGVLFSGGDDFDTARLGLGPTHPKATPVPTAKQDFDFELARAVLARGTPVLGICYGMQLLALAEGGRLHQHLPDDRPGAQPHSGGVEHAVALERGSRLAHATSESELRVVSRHHQAIASVGGAWSVSARDGEGLIEGIERADHPFALGVQWHPELSPEGDPNDRILRAFVNAAALHAARAVARIR